MEEIKAPCPFCGTRPEDHDEGSPILRVVLDDCGMSPAWFVKCSNCGADGPRASTKEEAVRLWNKMRESAYTGDITADNWNTVVAYTAADDASEDEVRRLLREACKKITMLEVELKNAYRMPEMIGDWLDGCPLRELLCSKGELK